MTTTGHIGASIILAHLPRLWGRQLTTSEQVAIVIAGNLPDLDLIFTSIVHYPFSHHDLPSHTPIFLLLLGLLLYILILKRLFSPLANILIFISMWLHLALDELIYYFSYLGWQSLPVVPQITWLFPITNFDFTPASGSIFNFIRLYFYQAQASLILEFFFISLAFLLVVSDPKIKSTKKVRKTGKSIK